MAAGWKTLILNGALAVVMALLTYVAGVDWTQYISPTAALIVTNAVNIILRFLTTTPIFNSKPIAPN